MLSVSDVSVWGTRRKYLLVLLCQLIGTPMFVALPNVAIQHGAIGNILGYLICYFAFGIPLLYMEFIICQFTARDSIDVWKARSCLSHIGYILVAWQVVAILSNHVNITFVFHYFVISFENPIPYYTCGEWAYPNCNILVNNYTVNKDCIRLKEPPGYCDKLYMTFSEYQYFKYKMLGADKNQEYFIAWRMCLASALICIFTFLACFQRKRSLGRVALMFFFYPIIGYTTLLVGSMLQKGVVVMYNAALDTDFSIFLQKHRASLLIIQAINNLCIGSGFNFNFGAGTSFRAPCYSNIVITVVVCAAVTILTVCTTAMMACPYAYEYRIEPYKILKSNIALTYEKIPRLLYEYENKFLWISLTLSSHVIGGLSTNMLFVHHLLELLGERCPTITRYPGLSALAAMVLLFLATIPLLGYVGMSAFVALKRFSSFLTTLTAILEVLVFILWYGIESFSEDVHFMQGLQPKKLMKVSWVISCAVLCYALSHEIYLKIKDYSGSLTDKIGWYSFLTTLILMITLCVLKLFVAALKGECNEATRLDPSWGPRNEVLQRSRTMFTAQAMTKEYLYRQYHLQAGVMKRQRASNCRDEMDI